MKKENMDTVLATLKNGKIEGINKKVMSVLIRKGYVKNNKLIVSAFTTGFNAVLIKYNITLFVL